jgi:CDP-diacylglycerol---glycerol-3-phosphate 3-phosphatidyltransferase
MDVQLADEPVAHSPKPVMNLPNLLTLSRLGLAVVLFALITYQLWWWSLVVFILAAITDWLDGYLARKQGLTSAFGRNFDPLVDKVLVGGVFIFLLPVPGAYLQPWMVTLVVARELIVTGLRSFFESQSVKFGADMLGKIKMTLQCAAIIGILLVLAMQADRTTIWATIQIALIWSMVVITAISGLQYLLKAFLILKS